MNRLVMFRLNGRGDRFPIAWPKGATIARLEVQPKRLCLWANCDTAAPVENRVLRVFGSGKKPPADAGEYLGTLTANDYFTYHIYAEPQP